MFFHQALAELVDNALSARTFTSVGAGQTSNTALIEITLEQLGNDRVRVIVADAGVGMSVDELKEHVFGLGKRGSTSTTSGSMNEHGFGLKNALSVLTGGDSSRFSMVTRSAVDRLAPDQFIVVKGPFSRLMSADDSGDRERDWKLGLQQLIGATTGTRVEVESDTVFFRTIWRRPGAPSRFAAYVTRLAEHLGVMYRRFLKAGDKIFLSWKPLGGSWSSPVTVIPIDPPYGTSKTEHLTISDGTKNLSVEYTYGENDYELRANGPRPQDAVQGDGNPAYPYPLRMYYQGSSARSGADVIVRNRLISTQVWHEIWSDLEHTVEYNKWLAEIVLDENFSTTNNKTGMNPNGSAWQALLDVIGPRDSPYSPSKTSPEQTEKSIEDQWAESLAIAVGNPDLVAQQVATWQGAVTADIVVYSSDKSTIDQIWEIKAGRGKVEDVYQLLAQWDGFVRDGLNPQRGVLYCRDFDHKPSTAVSDINNRKDASNRPYNLSIRHHASSGPVHSTSSGSRAAGAQAEAPVAKAPRKRAAAGAQAEAPVAKAPRKRAAAGAQAEAPVAKAPRKRAAAGAQAEAPVAKAPRKRAAAGAQASQRTR